MFINTIFNNSTNINTNNTTTIGNIKTISSFNDVIIRKEKTLILCDIDDTVISYDKNFDFFYNSIKTTPNMHIQLYNEVQLQQYAYIKYVDYRRKNKPTHCDYNGFKYMESILKNTGGEIMFLTARDAFSSVITRNQFTQIGLNYDDYKVHYTSSKVNKGYYINKHIDTTKYNDIIFIDDLPVNIETVSLLCPEITCYRFLYIQK
jgi:hypothetical protein